MLYYNDYTKKKIGYLTKPINFLHILPNWQLLLSKYMDENICILLVYKNTLVYILFFIRFYRQILNNYLVSEPDLDGEEDTGSRLHR